MESKQTDYVNAQFDDAQERIEKLYKEIAKQDTVGGENPIACQHCHMVWGWFGWSWIRGVYIWRKKNTIHLAAIVCAWNRNQGYSSTTDTIPVESWGIPPRTYGHKFETKEVVDGVMQYYYAYVIPDANGVHIEMGESTYAHWGDPIIIEASWSA